MRKRIFFEFIAIIILTTAIASASYFEDDKVHFAILSGYITEKIVAPAGKCKLVSMEFPGMNMSGSYSLTIANMNQDILFKTPDDDVIWSDEANVQVDVDVSVSLEETLMALVMYIPDDPVASFWIPVTPGEAEDEIGYNDLFQYPLNSLMGYTLFSPTWEGCGDSICSYPIFTKGYDQEVSEDVPTQIVPAWAANLSDPNGNAESLTFAITTNKDDLFAELPAIDAVTGNLTYTIARDAFGIAAVTVILKGEGLNECGDENASSPQQFTIRVNQVNDPPSFTKGADQNIRPDAGSQAVPGWAEYIRSGPDNESCQTLTFQLTTNNDAFFSELPVIDTETGDLSYALAEDASGTAEVTVTLTDSAGTENGGSDTSVPQTFHITSDSGNIPPSFAKGPDQILPVNAGIQSVPGWATDIAGTGNDSDQSLIFEITTDNDALFKTLPRTDTASGDLMYEVMPDMSGMARITVTLCNGSENGESETFQIISVPPGDVDCNGKLELKDGVAALQVLTGEITSDGICLTGEVLPHDQMIGFEEVLHVLRNISMISL